NSWWPWRSSSNTGKCVLRAQDGWTKRSCNEEQAFICERDINRQSIPLTVKCGNVQKTTMLPMKTITRTIESSLTSSSSPLLSSSTKTTARIVTNVPHITIPLI
ncbi:unnamed protein product, partial [Rotaria magnacalcarata]